MRLGGVTGASPFSYMEDILLENSSKQIHTPSGASKVPSKLVD